MYIFNEELQSLHGSPSTVRVMKSRSLRRAGHIARIEGILTGKPTGNRPLGRPWRRLEDNSRMNLKEIGISTRNRVDSAQGRDYRRDLLNAALNLRVP